MESPEFLQLKSKIINLHHVVLVTSNFDHGKLYLRVVFSVEEKGNPLLLDLKGDDALTLWKAIGGVIPVAEGE